MSNKPISRILLNRTKIPSTAPAADSLQYGELSLNYYDGKLFYKDASGKIQAFIKDALPTTGGVVNGDLTVTGTITGNINGTTDSALKDGEGNVISTTYATKQEAIKTITTSEGKAVATTASGSTQTLDVLPASGGVLASEETYFGYALDPAGDEKHFVITAHDNADEAYLDLTKAQIALSRDQNDQFVEILGPSVWVETSSNIELRASDIENGYKGYAVSISKDGWPRVDGPNGKGGLIATSVNNHPCDENGNISLDVVDMALKDGNGNEITTTYVTKASLSENLIDYAALYKSIVNDDDNV